MSSTNEENTQSESNGLGEVPIVGITRPSPLKAVRKDGKAHPYYQKFIPAYRRFAKTLHQEEEAYRRLLEIEESLDERLSELNKHVESSYDNISIYKSLYELTESVDNISDLLREEVFENSIWEVSGKDNRGVDPEDEVLLLEFRKGSPPEKEGEFVVHVGESSWSTPAEIERLRSKLSLLIRGNSIRAGKLAGRRDRVRAAFDAVQEVLFEYETGQQIGVLLEQNELVDRGDDEKKPGPDERISDEQIEAQIEELAERGIVDLDSVRKTPLGSKLADEFGHLGKRQYVNRIEEMDWWTE